MNTNQVTIKKKGVRILKESTGIYVNVNGVLLSRINYKPYYDKLSNMK